MNSSQAVKNDFLVFGEPQIEREEIDEVVKCLESGWIGTGPLVGQFEREFASYKGVDQAAAVSSCTAALHLSILAAGINTNDEVITTPLTFCASVNSIIHAGATPVLADVDLRTMNIDPEQVRERVTSQTRAILPVHFAGRPCDMDSLLRLAKGQELKVIEDCAHAIETEYKSKKAGTFGDFGCFSFYATKNVTTAEGGMVIARGGEELARIKRLALHGMSQDAWKRFSDEGYKHYYAIETGFKYNLTDLQAALGIHQLRRVESNWLKRKHVWERYNLELADLPIQLPAKPEADTRHGYHLYTILIDEVKCEINRDDFLAAMTKEQIGVGVHYLSIPEHPVYRRRFGWKPEDYPNAMRIGRQTVSLPLSAKLTDDDVDRVVEAVHGVLGRTQ